MINPIFSRSIATAFFLVLLSGTAFSQEITRVREPTFEEKLPKEVLKKDNQFLTATVENDLFGKGTDQNYTNGVRFTYHKLGLKPWDISRKISNLIPFFETNDTTAVYYSLGQNLYTPKNISVPAPDPTDRPYAAFLYGSAGLSTISKNHIDDVELTLGVVGPWALGKQTQKTVHKIVNSNDPQGWDYQLENEPGLMVSWQRRWPEALYHENRLFHFRTTPHVGLTAGNIYNYAATGVSFQLTPTQYKWQSTPLRVRPAMPGSGFFAIPEDDFAWSLFAGFEGRAMGRNIFLDGNTFRDSPSVDKEVLVMDANVGLSTTFGPAQISYTLNWRSKEFKNQDDESVFGAISIGYRF